MHDRERASTWREHKGNEKEKEDDAGKTDEKKYLNPKQKKKIAFINQEFHSSADNVHVYIVFAHPLPPNSRPSNLPPPPPTIDPYEAARLAAERCDGTSFMDRVIRVDLVNKKGLLSGEENALVESSLLDTDPKLSVFVGNLDFASKQEDLRVFFEGVVSAERGPTDEDSEDEGKTTTGKGQKTWVSRVRIVRDKETQLGKGFGYVQFTVRVSFHSPCVPINDTHRIEGALTKSSHSISPSSNLQNANSGCSGARRFRAYPHQHHIRSPHPPLALTPKSKAPSA